MQQRAPTHDKTAFDAPQSSTTSAPPPGRHTAIAFDGTAGQPAARFAGATTQPTATGFKRQQTALAGT